MIYTKCPICKKGNPFEICCGHDKMTGEKIITIFDYIRKALCYLGIHRWVGILPTRTNKQHRCIHCGKIKLN